MRYWNRNLISATERLPGNSLTSGIYDLVSQKIFKEGGLWPVPGLLVSYAIIAGGGGGGGGRSGLFGPGGAGGGEILQSDFVAGLTGTEGPYTNAELLAILATDAWATEYDEST